MNVGVLSSGVQIVANGLICWLDGSVKRSYSGTGSTWSDVSGKANNMSLVNTPTFNTGDGGYFTFDKNSNEYGIISSMTDANSATNWSICVAMRTTQADNFTGVWGGGNPIVYTLQTMSDGKIRWYNNGNTLDTTGSYNDNNWYLVTAVINATAGNFKTYVNNTEVLTSTAANLRSNMGTNDFYLATWGNNDYDYSGDIGFYLAYNIALTATQVGINYNAMKSRFGL